MVKLRCSASDRIRVPSRPAQQVHRRVPDLRCRATPDAPECIYHRRRAIPDLTIGPAEADQAGARPYLRRCAGTPRERIRFNLSPHADWLEARGEIAYAA